MRLIGRLFTDRMGQKRGYFLPSSARSGSGARISQPRSKLNVDEAEYNTIWQPLESSFEADSIRTMDTIKIINTARPRASQNTLSDEQCVQWKLSVENPKTHFHYLIGKIQDPSIYPLLGQGPRKYRSPICNDQHHQWTSLQVQRDLDAEHKSASSSHHISSPLIMVHEPSHDSQVSIVSTCRAEPSSFIDVEIYSPNSSTTHKHHHLLPTLATPPTTSSSDGRVTSTPNHKQYSYSYRRQWWWCGRDAAAIACGCLLVLTSTLLPTMMLSSGASTILNTPNHKQPLPLLLPTTSSSSAMRMMRCGW